MVLYPGVDASNPGHAPGNPLPAGTKIVAGYVGALDMAGQPDTPHVWTLDDWDQYLVPGGPLYMAGVRPLPIYTHNYPGLPETDAANAVDAMLDLGWSDKLGRILAWDAEFFSDESYVSGLRSALHARGFRLMTYERTILQDPSTDFRWIFNLINPPPPRVLPSGWDGWQWRFGRDWDFDVFSQAVYDGCGRGPRQVEP